MKTFIIAEAGVNHNGSLELARRLVDLAKKAGADAVKFQTFHAEDLVCLSAPKADYQKASTSTNESQYEMLKSLELSEQDQVKLHQYCKEQEIIFLSSPFDMRGVNFLCQTLALSLIKIPSGEITNLPLLLKVAQTGKPVILSTGMSSLGEIEEALAILAFGYSHPLEDIHFSKYSYNEIYYSDAGQKILQEKVSLLHCTSEYPAPFDEINLRAIQTLHQAFGLPVGYSDHTLGIAVAIAAVACGAKIIEKHFTLDKSLPGPDHQASLEPQDLTAMVSGIREVELALGNGKKLPTTSELKNRLIARKSLVSLEKINKGEFFSEKNIGCKRPGNGISPINFYNYQGKCAERNYEKDELIGN
ncbi:MAG: N-acetylneuraminic acid synthase [uncultured bacterium]|nr:MAG: N-acetylneuraminic acid synthase [uncultured bacterium]